MASTPEEGPENTRLRADKWLWQARFFKTRALAAALIEGGHLRVNGQKTLKPGHGLRRGDVLTFPQGAQIRVIRLCALGTRRGPAAEAQGLYEDVTAPPLAPLE